MIASSGPNHAKILDFILSDKETKAREFLLLKLQSDEPIDNYVADAAHAYAKDFLKDVANLIRCRLELNLDVNEYSLRFEQWNYNFTVKPSHYNSIYFRISTEKKYSMLHHFMARSYFREKFCLEFFNQIDEFFGPHSVDKFYLTWPSVKFIL